MITESYCVVSPAYRDYKKASDAKADFLDGKDFKMESVTQGNGYCSVRDFAMKQVGPESAQRPVAQVAPAVREGEVIYSQGYGFQQVVQGELADGRNFGWMES